MIRRFLLMLALLCPLAFAQTVQITFHVDQDGVDGPKGSDSNPGTQALPFATLDKARQAVRTKTNGNCDSVTKPIIVYVHGQRGGITYYFLTSTLTFTGTGSPNDNGCSSTAPVIFEVVPGENVVVSGGRLLTGWNCPHDPPQTGDVCTVQPTSPNLVNSEGLFYDSPASRKIGGQTWVSAWRHRPRLGASGSGGSSYTNYRILTNVDLLNFEYTHTDPIAAFLNFNPAGGACNVSVNTGAFPSLEVEVVTEEKWQEARMRLCSENLGAFTLTMSGSLNSGGNDGYFVGHRYWLDNVLTGADIPSSLGPGNWYLDRRLVPFTLYYKVQAGENPKTATMIIPQTTGPIIDFESISFVKFYGFQFSHDNPVTPNAGFASQQNNWNQEPNEFFKINNGTDDDVIGNTFTQVMGISLAYTTDTTVSTGLNQNEILSNSVYDVGSGGLYAGQFAPSAGDTDANILNGSIIRNNWVCCTGRFSAGEAGIAVLMSHDVRVSHNEVSYTYGTGFTDCIPSAAGGSECRGGSSGINRNVQEYNLAHHIAQGVLGDSAAAGFYNVPYQALGVVADHNICHDVSGNQILDPVTIATTDPGNGGTCFYWDNISCCGVTTNNLCYRVSLACWKNTRAIATTYSGHVIDNNIFAFAINGTLQNHTASTIGPNGNPVAQFTFTRNYVEYDKTYLSTVPFYLQMECGPFGAPFNYVQSYDRNRYYNPTTDLSSAGYTTFFRRLSATCTFVSNLTFAGWQALGQDLASSIPTFGSNPFVNPFYPTDNFTLAEVPPNGFVAFSLTAPGLDYQNQPPHPLATQVPDTRITAPYNPATDF